MKTHDRNNDAVAVFGALTAENSEQMRPFRWQIRLLDHLVEGDIPIALDIPTGLGKTSVMALWLIALAKGADLPKRMVYVVDRRAVVDQATRFAERLRNNMTPILAEKLHLGEGALPISTLRGGFADNREWLEDPSKPAILVGTIDMIGSRLLFEGYGVSRRMRPYHAGLLGVDALVVLDEAHLCPPFEALLRQIKSQRDSKFGPTGRSERPTTYTPPFRLMSLSATGRRVDGLSANSDGGVFRLCDEDSTETLVRWRLQARKRLGLEECSAGTLPEELARRALELGYGAAPRRVLVYCDKRRDAVSVKASIDKEIKVRAKAHSIIGASELLVGERRIHEREALEDWLDSHGFIGAGSVADRPMFLVATSAGEVGVDLDADHMVCDLVAFERMVQRLGRVNRRGGETRRATIDVLLSPPRLPANASKNAKLRHQQEMATFRARKELISLLPCGVDERHDASPSECVSLRSQYPDQVELASTRAPLHPELTRPLVEAWALTSLKEHEGRAEVAPWLRGWEADEEPQVNVVWRKYLPRLRQGDKFTTPRSMIAEFFQCAPVHVTEQLEALRSHVTDWLKKRVQRMSRRSIDDEPVADKDEIVALVIDRAGELIDKVSLRDLVFICQPGSKLKGTSRRQHKRRVEDWDRSLSGNTLIVDSRIGGLADGMLEEKCDAEAVSADNYEAWGEIGHTADERDDQQAQLDPLLNADTDTNARKNWQKGFRAVKFQVRRLGADNDEEGLAETGEFAGWHHLRTFETDFDSAGNVRGGLAVFKRAGDPGEDHGKSILSRPQTLQDHANQVAATVRRMAERLKLPVAEVNALEHAARLHDDGKAAECWQNAMNAPKDKDGRPYAKTQGGGDLRQLGGYRHEFGSLLKAEQQPLPDKTRDLILHLISAHHGHSRPLIPTTGCKDASPSVLAAKAGEAALRFARLQQRYGIWGLAWREAILRAADASASRDWDNQSQGRSNND